MKIVAGLLLSVFCVGSAFSCEVDHESSVFERISDDILQNMPQTDLISRIKVLEDAYDNIVFERDYYKNAADQLLITLKERDAQLEDVSAQLERSHETLRETVEMIGQNPSDFGDVPPITEESEIIDDPELLYSDDPEMIPAHPTMGSYPPPLSEITESVDQDLLYSENPQPAEEIAPEDTEILSKTLPLQGKTPSKEVRRTSSGRMP